MSIYEILSNKIHPWEDLVPCEQLLKEFIIAGKRPLLHHLDELYEGNSLIENLKNVIAKCWDQDPCKRPQVSKANITNLCNYCIQILRKLFGLK